MVTLKDIAIACEVSISTVSRSLRSEGYVERKVKEMVLIKANELGYIPNLNARNLQKSNRDTIGIIVPDIKNYFYSIVLERLVLELQRNGYKVLITYSFENLEIEAENFTTLLSSKVAAIIFTPVSNKNKNLMQLACKQNVPVLQLYRDAYPSFDSIVIDDSRGAFLATDHLIKSGYKNIILFTIKVEMSPHRSIGYREAHVKNGMEVKNHNIVKLPFSTESYGIILDSINRLKPDAIIAGTNNFGVETLNALDVLQLKLHNDVEVIIFDDMDWFNTLKISSVAQPIGEIEREITARIISKIEKQVPYEECINIKIQPKLITRES